MKLSSYAKKVGVSYKTAHRWWKAGQISGYQLPTGTIVVIEEKSIERENIACIYARVDNVGQKQQLAKQVIKLKQYAIAKKYKIYQVQQEIASGCDERQHILERALRDDNYNILLVESCDRLALNGINYIKILLEKTGKKLEIADL
jgi:predicted site-specific integrase-resolvase